MKTVRVLQLGAEDFSKSIQVSDAAEWHYEPDFSELPEKDFDVAVLDREVAEEEFAYLIRFLRAYCLFVMEAVPLTKGKLTHQLFVRKMGRRLSAEKLEVFLKEDLPDYFSGSYGEKYRPQELAIAQGFKGKVAWRGFEGVDLEGDYGNELTQIVFWRYNVPITGRQTLEFWLEYEKDDTVEISLEIVTVRFGYGTDPDLQDVRMFSEKELDSIIYVENRSDRGGYLFTSLRAKGHGCLRITALHDRHSRKGKGIFMPGGKRAVTSEREEIFYYFDPGNLRPPLNVYFSGYKTQEGFEGYYMMRGMEHPFLLIAEARLEGGGFYLGSGEYENAIEHIIRKHMKMLKFQDSQVILSGLSMGTFGALYYGCRIRPNTILLGKLLASIGDVAGNERIQRPGGFPTSLDVLHKTCGSLSGEAIDRLNARFWDAFDHTDWSGTRFAVAYMVEDDYDSTAYEQLQSHLKDAGARIYGKGLHGRHNDNTSGIVGWFQNQYREIIKNDFDRIRRKTGGQKQ
ncbi:accessory Sec system protein Asp2 [uncultured Acetatifactor sp.]|uniref:accessory Sec system protein Asp2 n=1 Tax=uncultured Acetatifactor sp. TaxID=1671927 RepID=UPI00262D98E6|nr:accessory Sec system protein Asp2 [uncultured Acetatifactor sp.]